MARRSLADIRASMKKEATNTGGNYQGDNASYPFWNIPDDSTAIVRFLPDGDKSNDDGFWVERLMINLDFKGIKGEDNDFARVQVPCVEMYGNGNSCPVQAEIKPWYKDPSLEESANKYWKKRSFLYQGFVNEHPGFVDKNGKTIDDNNPENPIRRFVVNPNLHKVVRAILLDPELEVWPDDFEGGLNFSIRKTKDGKWASYDTSSWARKESALSDDQLAAIEEHGLFDLKDFLPRQPSETDLKVIFEMFEASVDGEKYDPERWGSFYRPAGMQKPEGAEKRPAVAAPESKEEESPLPDNHPNEAKSKAPEPAAEEKAESTGDSSSSDRAAEILARIRKNQS